LKLVLGCGCEKVAADVAAMKVQLTAVLTLLQALQTKENLMASNLTSLTASVTNNTTVIGSALTLIQGFSAQLAAAGSDPVALAALQASIDSSDTALAAAVAANTGTPPASAGPPAS
jgi:hypothetical protein